MLITLEPRGIFGSIFVYLCILTCPATGMHTDDEGSMSMILVGRALLVGNICSHDDKQDIET